MKLILETDRNGNLIARQTGAGILRYIIGLPLLAFGLLLLYGVFSSTVITLIESGSAGIGSALIGAFMLLLLTAMTLPMGWWLVLSRSWITLDSATLEVVETTDWRVGKKVKRTPLSNFRAVRLATEALTDSSSSKRTKVTYVQMIRLLAKKPTDQVSIEMGWSDEKERSPQEEVALEISRAAGLPLEVLPIEIIAKTPIEEDMDRDEEAEARDDE